jgi:predicted nucleic acid-binding protein
LIMRLLDTSVWIPFLRRKGDEGVKRHVANLIAASEAAYTCPVQFELMAGAQEQELPGVLEALSFATRIEMTRSDWDLAADSARALRTAGATVPQDDLLIASVAFARRIPIVCRDQHFSLIQAHVYPRLLVEQI